MLKARPDWLTERVSPRTLPIAACLFAVAGTGVCSENRVVSQPAQATQVVTVSVPEVRLPLPPKPSAASVLIVRVTEIQNPDLTPVSLDVAFAPCSGSAKIWEPERLASLGVYPADQLGDYSVPVTRALARLTSRGVTDLKDVCVQVRLRLPQDRKPSSSIEVTLIAPEWRDDK
jgi:hypothetical protein